MSNVSEEEIEVVIEDLSLEELLSEVLDTLSKNKDQQYEIDDILFSKHKITRGTLDKITANKDEINRLNKIELCVLTAILFNVTKDSRINPSLHFTAAEINKALKYKFENVDEIEFPYTFEGVMKLTKKDYLTAMSYKDIASLYNNELLTYNHETQRSPKKKLMKNNTIKKTPTVVNKSVINITRLMKENKFPPSTLVFNILCDGNDTVEYEDGDLIIGEGTTLNLIDGMHRVQAILKVIEGDPNYKGIMEVSIRHYTLNEARFLLGILNTVNKVDKTLVKFNTDETIGGEIVKDLILIPELKDRIETESTGIKKTLNILTNYAVLANAINDIFDPKSTKDRLDITSMLKNFFGYLLSSYPEEFTKNMKVSRSTSWKNHHNLYVGWIVVAKMLYDKYGVDFPTKEITRIVDSIDYTKKSGSKLDLIMEEQGNRNSDQSKMLIRKFFEEKVSELI